VEYYKNRKMSLTFFGIKDNHDNQLIKLLKPKPIAELVFSELLEEEIVFFSRTSKCAYQLVKRSPVCQRKLYIHRVLLKLDALLDKSRAGVLKKIFLAAIVQGSNENSNMDYIVDTLTLIYQSIVDATQKFRHLRVNRLMPLLDDIKDHRYPYLSIFKISKISDKINKSVEEYTQELVSLLSDIEASMKDENLLTNYQLAIKMMIDSIHEIKENHYKNDEMLLEAELFEPYRTTNLNTPSGCVSSQAFYISPIVFLFGLLISIVGFCPKDNPRDPIAISGYFITVISFAVFITSCIVRVRNRRHLRENYNYAYQEIPDVDFIQTNESASSNSSIPAQTAIEDDLLLVDEDQSIVVAEERIEIVVDDDMNTNNDNFDDERDIYDEGKTFFK